MNLFIFSFLTLLIPLYAFDIELTILVPANQRECFHQNLELGKSIEVEYEVLAGGDLDINYWFYSPTNRVLQSDFKKRDGHQTLKLEETGEYRFCLDNSFSRFSQKQVYFSLRPVNEQGQNEFEQPTGGDWMNNVDKDELGELQNKIQDIKDVFQRIWNNMESAQLEHNFERINFWSIINLCLMITVTVIQVITIRSLFESKSAYGKFLRGKK